MQGGIFDHGHAILLGRVRGIGRCRSRRCFERGRASKLTRSRKAGQNRRLPRADAFQRLQPVFDLIRESARIFVRDMFGDSLEIPEQFDLELLELPAHLLLDERPDAELLLSFGQWNRFEVHSCLAQHDVLL